MKGSDQDKSFPHSPPPGYGGQVGFHSRHCFFFVPPRYGLAVRVWVVSARCFVQSPIWF